MVLPIGMLTGVLTAYEREEFNMKSLTTNVTLFRNGHMLIQTNSSCWHWGEGLRGRVFVVCIDDQGRAIWVTEEFACTTCGSRFDITAGSKHQNVFQTVLPEVIAKYTQSLDIAQYNGASPTDWRERLRQQIKDTTDLVDEVKTVVAESLA
jgi:hypothetical protein